MVTTNTSMSGTTPNDSRLSDVASRAASDVSRAATDIANSAASSVKSLANEGRAYATEQLDATARWVNDTTRAHPVRTLGFATLIGLVVGLLIGRR